MKISIVGVGPGDPSLLTLAAVDAIKKSTLVAYPTSNHTGNSISADIASAWISDDKKRLPIHLPMVTDLNTLQKAWRNACNQLMKAVYKGENVVFLTQGDSSLFSTGSYIYMEIKNNYPDCLIEIIPGVNSFSAAAALGGVPLACQREQLLILPVPENPEHLKKILNDSFVANQTLVLIKVGQKWDWIRLLLHEMNLLSSSLFAQRLGFDDQQVLRASEVPKGIKPYFSLLIIRKELPSSFS